MAFDSTESRNSRITRKQTRSFPERLPSLDGWRAICIFLVLGMHCVQSSGFPVKLEPLFRYFDGDFAVRCFFVLSGFLITWLLINEHEQQGKVSLKHFYIRRFLRIFPVYFTFMGVLWIAHLLTPFNQTRRAWVTNLTFTTDFYFPTWTSAHLWSLSVEEQFYLLWPVLFIAFALARKPATALKILVVPVIVAPIWRIISYKQYFPAKLSPLFLHGSFFNNFDCLAIGCLGAFALKLSRQDLETWLVARAKPVLGLGLIMILTPYVWALGVPGRIIAGFGPTFQGFGFALLMLQSVMPANRKLFSPLNWTWVRHLGVLSYSIYIWQQLFCTRPETFGLGPVWWMTFPGWLLAALVAAHLSYYVLERPLFRLRSRFR